MLKDNETKRIDSEYFKKNYLKMICEIKSKEGDTLDKIATVSGGKRLPLGETFTAEGIRYIRAEDVKNSFVDSSNSPYISHELHERLKRYITQYNDILLTNVGNSIGDVAFYREKTISNLTENCVKIHKCNRNVQEILFAFFLSKFGRQQIERETVGTAQPKLALERIRKFYIPRFSDKIASKIKEKVDESNTLMELSKDLYKEAEQDLNEQIDIRSALNDLKNYTVKKFSEIDREDFRIDAEYYRLKYDKLYDVLNQIPTEKLGKLVSKKKSIEPGSEFYRNEGIPFVRVSNLFVDKITTTSIFLNKYEIKNLEKLYPKKDTILLSKDGSIGIAYKIEEDLEIVTSGAILHLNIKDLNKILPDYLTLVLNSNIVKLQAERDSNGAIIQHWKPTQIDDVIIPILDIEIQERIADKVKKSFELKKESEKLLNLAKKAIEIAIEETEDVAINYINKNK